MVVWFHREQTSKISKRIVVSFAEGSPGGGTYAVPMVKALLRRQLGNCGIGRRNMEIYEEHLRFVNKMGPARRDLMANADAKLASMM
jgi:hypothetical protein